MSTCRIIPCLDIREGRVVKGVQFVGLRDAGDPVELARWYDSEGADELVFLNITASYERRTPVFELASRVAEQVFIPFTVGGGIRTLADIRSILQAGADKISLNTVAVENPTLISEAAERFGIQCVVVAIDARWNGAYYEVYTHGGAHPNRQKCHRVGANGRSAWRRRNLVDQYGSRRHSAWLRTHLDTPSR